MTRKERVISNLSQYPNISKYLGKAIRKRLEIKGYTRGILTAHLLDSEASKKDVERLEQVLQLGEKYCTDFKYIFKEMNLPNKDLAIDGEIINTLAEVKAFEVLYSNHFEDIKKIKPAQGKTADFTAKRNDIPYAIEVIRINLPVSDKKSPKPDSEKHIIDKSGVTLASMYQYSSDTTGPKWEFTIKSATKEKYSQLEEYIKNQDKDAKGIIIISVGRDYFVSKFARRDMFLPRTLYKSLKNSFIELKQTETYPYLQHVFFIAGKLENQTHLYPELNKEHSS